MTTKQLNHINVAVQICSSITNGCLTVQEIENLNLSEVVEHLTVKFEDHMPERIMLRRDLSNGILRTHKKKVRTSVRTWHHSFASISGNISLKFDISGKEFQTRDTKGKLFEIEWSIAKKDPVSWYTWESTAYQETSFEQKLETMTESERVLALKEKYGAKYVDQPIAKKLTNLQKLDQARALIELEEDDPFEFKFPDRLLELMDKVSGIRELYKWFKEECEPKEKKRRRALVLYSKIRGLGKTSLVEELCGYDESRWIYVSGISFASKNFENEETAKLLLLDDFVWDQNKEEIVKGLVTSRRVTIRDCNLNKDFHHGLPTILTLNRQDVWERLRTSSMFNKQCCFIELKCYIGPPDKRPAWLDTPAIWEGTISTLDLKEEENLFKMNKEPNRSIKEKLSLSQLAMLLEEDSNTSERFEKIMKKVYNDASEDTRKIFLAEFASTMLRCVELVAKNPTTVIHTINNNHNYPGSIQQQLPSSSLTGSMVENIAVITEKREGLHEKEENASSKMEEEKKVSCDMGISKESAAFEKPSHAELEKMSTQSKKLCEDRAKTPSDKKICKEKVAAPSSASNKKGAPSDVLSSLNDVFYICSERYEYCDITKLLKLLTYAATITTMPSEDSSLARDNNKKFNKRVDSFDGFKRYYDSCVHSHEKGPQRFLIHYQSSSRMRKVNARYGRLYGMSNGGQGICMQNFNKPFRGYLCHENYWDIDLVNSHPSLLIWLLTQIGQEVPDVISQYVENRETWLQEISSEYPITRDQAKKLMLRLIYGGSLEHWAEDNSLLLPKKKSPTTKKLEIFSECLARVMKSFSSHPHFAHIKNAYSQSIHAGEKWKSYGLASLILQEYEKKLLLFVEDFLQKNEKRRLDVLIHDGGHIQRKSEDGDTFPQRILDRLNGAVRLRFSSRNLLVFVHKPFDLSLVHEIESQFPYEF
jgi:hypothetical protein